MRYPFVMMGRMRFRPPPPPRSETLEINAPVQRDGSASHWNCPICETEIHHVHRAGRQRVYCSNACRQKAYRRRCDQRQAWAFEHQRQPRPARAATRDRVHAIREHRDDLSGRRTSERKGVTVCGAFARMSIDRPDGFGHLRFVGASGSHAGTTCRRCEVLTGTGDGAAPLPWTEWSHHRWTGLAESERLGAGGPSAQS